MSTVQITCNLTIPLLLEKWPSRHLWIMVSLGFGAVGSSSIDVRAACLYQASCSLSWDYTGRLVPISLIDAVR